MTNKVIIHDVLETATAGGAGLVGFADLSGTPESLRSNLPFSVSFAVPLNPSIASGISLGPTPEYSIEYDRVNRLIDGIATSIAGVISDAGYRSIPASSTVMEINKSTFSTNFLPHKTSATRAGIGWIGRCALLVTRKYGSAVRLGTVFTDMPVFCGEPIVKSLCGECCECVSHCPAQALTGRKWQSGLERQEMYNVQSCYNHVKQNSLRPEIGKTNCGICIAVCPWTKKYLTRSNSAN